VIRHILDRHFLGKVRGIRKIRVIVKAMVSARVRVEIRVRVEVSVWSGARVRVRFGNPTHQLPFYL